MHTSENSANVHMAPKTRYFGPFTPKTVVVVDRLTLSIHIEMALSLHMLSNMKPSQLSLVIWASITVGILSAGAPSAAAEVPKAKALAACLGANDRGSPVIFAALTKNMQPVDVGAIFKGAETVSEAGMATVKASGCPGAAEFQFYFAKDKANGDALGLSFARIVFDRKLAQNEKFYTTVVKLLSAKYGEPKQAAVRAKHISWVSEDNHIVQFGTFLVLKGKRFQNISGALVLAVALR